MDEQMRAALIDLISLGSSQEDVVRELVSASYNQEESLALYKQVKHVTDEAQTPEPDLVTPTETPPYR